MKNFTMTLSFFLCFTLVADDHIDKKETMKDNEISEHENLTHAHI